MFVLFVLKFYLYLLVLIRSRLINLFIETKNKISKLDYLNVVDNLFCFLYIKNIERVLGFFYCCLFIVVFYRDIR